MVAYLLLVILLPFSCNESQFSGEETIKKTPDFIDPAVVITDDDKLKAERIHTVTKVLREIYRNRSVVEEVNAAVATGYYVDETIMLKDLLNPETSPVYQMESFKERARARGVQAGLFKQYFEEALGNQNARQMNDDYFYNGDIYIYFPYHEQTSGYNQIPVVVPATVEADEAWAYQPYGPEPDIINPPGHMTLVNDNYAELYQTHVVGDGGVEIYPQANQQNCQGNSLKVSAGYVKIYYHQYDPFVSFNDGGGAEIRIGLARGSQNGSTVTSFEKQIQVYVRRRNARNAIWTEAWEDLETSWSTAYPRLLFAVYEKDPTHDIKTFTGTLEWINLAGQTITSNYSINVRTRNTLISNDRWLRSYLVSLQSQFGNTPEYILGYGPSWTGSIHSVTRYSLPLSCY